MNEKTCCILLASIVFLAAVLFPACNTTTAAAGQQAGDELFDYQRRVAELEAAIRYSDERLASDIEELAGIRDRASEIGDTVDRVIYLFEEYSAAVEQLVRDYNNLRATVGTQNEDNVGASCSIGD